MLGQPGWRHVLGLVDQLAYGWLALGVIAALWWLVARHQPTGPDTRNGGGLAAVPDPPSAAVAGASRPRS
jgi:hypothetical protein